MLQLTPLKPTEENLKTISDGDILLLNTTHGWDIGTYSVDREYGPIFSIFEEYISPKDVKVFCILPNPNIY